MKKIFLILICSSFSGEVLAQSYTNLGIINDLTVTENAKFIKNIEPKISNRFIGEVAFDDNYQSTNRQNEYKESFAKVRFYSNFHLNKQVWISSYLKLDRIDNQNKTDRRNATSRGGGDRSFENIGVFFEELNLNSSRDNYSLIAGKFNLNFGSAWRWDRGLWIHNIADGYKQAEKLGFSGIYRLGDSKKTGQYSFSFSTFTNDRKNLDNALMVERNTVHKSDARPGDTRSLQSYSASMNINFDFSELEKLTYHFSYIDLAVNERASSVTPTKIDDQKGFSAGMNYQYPINKNLVLDGMLEYAKMKNVNGNSDITDDYFTANIIARFYKNWTMLLGNASTRRMQVEQFGYDQNLSEISFGYEFDKTNFFDKFTLQAGYKNLRTNNKTSLETQNVFGLLVRYYKNF